MLLMVGVLTFILRGNNGLQASLPLGNRLCYDTIVEKTYVCAAVDCGSVHRR